jgi:hypothetical protein
MRRALVLVCGGLMVLLGLLWTLQGLGRIGGSPMSGVEAWAIIGPAVAGLGVALMIVGMRGTGPRS